MTIFAFVWLAILFVILVPASMVVGFLIKTNRDLNRALLIVIGLSIMLVIMMYCFMFL